MMPGIKKDKIKQAHALVKEATKIMSASPDNDGVGYAAITKDGHVYGEKWLKPVDAWSVYKNPEPPKPSNAELFLERNFKDYLKDFSVNRAVEDVYDKFGNKTIKNLEDTVAILLHTRNKTEGNINLENTHPFYYPGDGATENTALIHNGTIKNYIEISKEYKTGMCDSKVILEQYLDLGINYYSENIKDLADILVGWYTVGVLTSLYDENGEAEPVLDIFKSNKELVCGYVEELECPVFATTKHILEKACENAKLTLVGTYDLKDGVFLRLDAITGEVIEDDVVEFEQSAKFYSAGKSTGATKYEPKDNSGQKSILDMKKDFEKDHPEYFNDEYYKVADLTKAEKEALKELEGKDNPDHRALYLVKRAFDDKSA